MSVQDWIVILIVLFCVAVAGRWIVRFFRSVKNNENPCANCATGCDLKRALEEKQKACKKDLTEKSKKSNG